jgi:hypothetical protein
VVPDYLNDYLTEYIHHLKSADGETYIYDQLAEWQWQCFVNRRHAAAVNQVNEHLKLAGDFLLRADHLPTTAVGRLDGLVIVSANPGYSEHANGPSHACSTGSTRTRRNGSEHDARMIPGQNGLFCRDIFHEYRKLGRTVRYWSYAQELWRMVFASNKPILHGGARWDRAHEERWALGGLDLVPFHSRKDGVIAKGKLTNKGSLSSVALLASAAEETLKMICRLPSGSTTGDFIRRLILVSSGDGARIVDKIALQGDLQLKSAVFGPHAWRMKLYESKNGSRLVSVPYQVFSRNGPPGFSRERLAESLKLAVLPH